MATASSDILANGNRGDEQLATGFLPVNATSKESTPPPSSSEESVNKRKRESVGANLNTNEETKSPRVSDTNGTGVVETSDAKEVEMKDAAAESSHTSVDKSQSVKEVEMQDAEVAAPNKTNVEEKGPEIIDNNETRSYLGANEGSKEDERGRRKLVEVSESSESGEGQRDDGTGQHVLGEVATLLKQVQETDSKAKLEVEVKVKKMEEDGEVREEDPSRGSGRVSCP